MTSLLRTPDARFERLSGYPFAPHYMDDLKTAPGARLHYLDEGESTTGEIFLCLHGAPTWSYLYRKMIPILSAPGHRVIAPDFIGCGKSDKLTDSVDYTYHLHRHVLCEFVSRLDLQNITLVCQDWGGLVGMTLPMDMPGRFTRLLVMNTTLAPHTLRLNPAFRTWRLWARFSGDLSPGRVVKLNQLALSPGERAAYDAPFPDRRYKVGVRAFPTRVPLRPVDDGAAVLHAAERWWRQEWRGDTFMVVGTRDRALGLSAMLPLQQTIRSCPEPLLVDTGHYVQERGEEVATRALEHFGLSIS